VELPRSDAAHFHPGGRILALTTRDDGTTRVVLWDWIERKELARLPHPCGGSRGFSPDGKLLATVEVDERVRVWDVAEVLERCRPEE
jgi:hypothetical protein